MSTSGAVRFARYAFPPNSLGYCGPDDSIALLEYAHNGISNHGLRQLAQEFSGAWPYLELIAEASGIDDPLDDRVVEAYWIGNDLLRYIDAQRFCLSLDERFRTRVGPRWSEVLDDVASVPGSAPHHSFHVFAVYPWVGLLRAGFTEPLRVLDRCRIRTGRVISIDGDAATVRYRPLTWDRGRLALAEPVEESVTVAQNGRTLAGPLGRGDVVSLHWDWVCERVTRDEARRIGLWTQTQVSAVNGHAVPGPAVALG